MSVQDFIASELEMLDRQIVATPATREYLESFAIANSGSMDIVLMQMSMNYGYKIALQNVQEKLERDAENFIE